MSKLTNAVETGKYFLSGRAAKDAKTAWDESGAVIKRMLRVQFNEKLMSKAVRQAYEEISATEQFVPDEARRTAEVRVTVPAHIPADVAKKALKQIKLEGDPTFDLKVTWEGKPGRQITISEPLPKGWKPQ